MPQSPNSNLPAKPPKPHFGRGVIWRNGQPVPIYTPPITTQNVIDMQAHALQLTYKPQIDDAGKLKPGEEEYIGMAKLEVGMHKSADKVAAGDHDELAWTLDRLVGKPKQSVETVTMSMTYQDFVSSLPAPTIDELEDIGLTPDDVVDIEISGELTDNISRSELDETDSEDLLAGL